jgi:predicted ATP-binding protein involved in virulence
MRIQNIIVKGLFNSYTYSIKLNYENRATIIIGPNGYGKTTLLKMLSGLFNGNFYIFYRVPFTEFKIEFDNKTTIKLQKRKVKKGENEKIELLFTYPQLTSDPKTKNLMEFVEKADQRLPFLEDKYSDDEWIEYRLLNRYGMRGEKQSVEKKFDVLEGLFSTYSQESNTGEITSASLRRKISYLGKDFLEVFRVIHFIKVHFIQTQRLIAYTKLEKQDRSEKETPVVNLYSQELAKLIESTLAQSMQQAQKLDSTFPGRVITKTPPKGVAETYNKLLIELEEIRNQRVHLRDTGILVDLGDNIEITGLIEDQERLNFLNGVLTEYISDTREKLAIFDDLSSKIELLKKIINERFSNKEFQIDKDKGFTFKTIQGEELSPDSLSSGEQQELVLFYEFLFRVPKNSLLLIDEPELSLHIEWQQKFLKDLINIAELVGFDVLIATHAPSIINDYWSLAVDLGEISK